MGFFEPPLNHVERRNVILYILGLMCYKFALDSVLHAFDKAISVRVKTSAPLYWAATLSLNISMQCFGSLMVSPLIFRFPIQRILSIAIIVFGIMIAIFPIVISLFYNNELPNASDIQSNLVPLLIFLYGAAGFSQGVVELVRRVIPQRIIGSNSERLKSLDSTAHIFYEVAGVTGAITSHFIIHSDKNKTSITGMYLFPALVIPASFLWSFLNFNNNNYNNPIDNVSGSNSIQIIKENKKITFFKDFIDVFKSFGHSVKNGFYIIFWNRSLIWLVPAYSLPLLLHRYLEGILLKQHAITKHGNGDLRLVFVGGSNFGELCGAIAVLLMIKKIPSPLPWLRLDAITLFLTWVLFVLPNVEVIKSDSSIKNQANYLLIIGIFFICSIISFGFASGDVSLAAYIQNKLAGVDGGATRTSPLGSVMAFLYVCYILLFALTSIPINYMAKGSLDLDLLNSIIKWSCIIYSLCAFIIFSATFIPRGSFGINPILTEDDKQMNIPNLMIKKTSLI